MIYAAGCETDGGIYSYEFENGKLKFNKKTEIDRPMYAIFEDGKIYVLKREGNDENSCVVCYDIKGGALVNPKLIGSTNGLCGCHLCMKNKNIYVANYISGSICKVGGALVTHTGDGPNKPRQDKAHCHYIEKSPDGKYLLAVDLGEDTIYTYDENLNEVSSVKAPAGYGPRHLISNGNIVYCANELISSVSVYTYDDGKLTLKDTVSTLPDDFKDFSKASAIRFNNGYVYVSNRGHDSVAVFKADGEKLTLTDIAKCGGISPRDINIFGGYVICANETSGDLTVMKIKENGKLEFTGEKAELKGALWVDEN